MPATTMEYRSFALMQPVQDEQRGYIVEGYATTFDDPYEMGFGTSEVIRSSALDGADMADVIFNLNHEGQPLARLRNGSMALERDAHGLKVRADLGGSQAGRELYEGIVNGLVDRMSWAFTVAEGGWDYDEAIRTAYVNRIERVYDVSAVSIPANEGTEIHARSYLGAVSEMQQRSEAAQDGKSDERARLALALAML